MAQRVDCPKCATEGTQYGEQECHRARQFVNKTIPNQSGVRSVRERLDGRAYAEALTLGRAELARGCVSSELLVPMATAAQLGDGTDCSLDEVREWLERAVEADPLNLEAKVELGHFLDAVVDEPALAGSAFLDAMDGAMNFIGEATEGLRSAREDPNKETEERMRGLAERVSAMLGSIRALLPADSGDEDE